MAHMTKVTPKKKVAFCKSLVETGGNVSKAALLIGVARQNCYVHKEADPEFAQAWDDAVEEGTEDLEEEARRRAYKGVLEPVFHQGAECGFVRKYSNTLLIFLLKGRKPDVYRDRTQVQLTSDPDNPIQFILIPEEGRDGDGNGRRKATTNRSKK